MFQLHTDLLRLIVEQLPYHHRTLRMSCQRMRTLLSREKLPPIDDDIKYFCVTGELAVLKLYPREQLEKANTWTKKGLCEIAAKSNNLELLKWLYSLGITWTSQTTRVAAKKKHFVLLQWAIDHGCPFNWMGYHYLSKHNNVTMIRSLLGRDPVQITNVRDNPEELEIGDTDRNGIIYGAAEGGHIHILQEFRDETLTASAIWLNIAASHGQIEVVKWLHKEGCPVDESTMTSAALSGNIELMTWLAFSAGCSLTDGISSQAARSNHLHVLQWLVANGGSLAPETLNSAAGNGNIEMIKWLQQQGFILNVTTTAGAASHGRLGCLQWLREQGCPWNEEACLEASFWKQLEVLQWARTNGCPWNRQWCLQRAGSLEIQTWIESQPD